MPLKNVVDWWFSVPRESGFQTGGLHANGVQRGLHLENVEEKKEDDLNSPDKEIEPSGEERETEKALEAWFDATKGNVAACRN
ncbi:hypothetical protein NDU88_003431 [Pleurodeles waltl]|uniref:Uncharacterized protein n=1 Tax=Pleurodeles waltl TaxID=8319 RepID=A0AAV7WP41_PLEWA|nr:hypothetical protein NDU88_003431 [Pleurodeles waltl]